MPFIGDANDFLFLVTFEETQKLAQSPLEAMLMRSGEEPTDKKAVLRVDPAANEILGIQYHPPNAEWYWISKIELVLNPVGYQQLLESGQVRNTEHSQGDLCVQDTNFVPGR